jgi:hypothetical protein
VLVDVIQGAVQARAIHPSNLFNCRSASVSAAGLDFEVRLPMDDERTGARTLGEPDRVGPNETNGFSPGIVHRLFF